MSGIFEEKAKPLPILKQMVWEAYKKVKANKGGAGIDKVSIQKFEENLVDNLYKLWNRLSSGSYFPPPVKEKEIPKGDGRTRILGIPTVADRVAQQVVKDYLEPRFEAIFHPSSYGYRPKRGAHQALTAVRNNIREYAWVIDLDIQAFFDNVDHHKLMLALERHVDENWAKMYIQRWLAAPMIKESGEQVEKTGQGTPQGGVISPLLSNLYLHYTFDLWMEKHFHSLMFVRYADDIIIHCRTEAQAEQVLKQVRERMRSCSLTVHPEKTHIVYCKDYRRKLKGKAAKFDFLGFSFQPMGKRSYKGGMFLGYDCRLSKKKYSSKVEELRQLKIHRWTQDNLQDIANALNPKIRGWINYYDGFKRGSLKNVFHRLHNRLFKWALNKYKRFRRSKRRAIRYIKQIKRDYLNLFYHWQMGYPLV